MQTFLDQNNLHLNKHDKEKMYLILFTAWYYFSARILLCDL